MEPDDIPVHDLLGVGDKPEPGPDELRAIVARAGRRRWAMAGVAAALALGLGLGVGFAASSQSTPSTSQTATAGPAPTQNSSDQNASGGATPAAPSTGANSGTNSSASATPSLLSPEHFTRLFTRTAGGVTIRGFLVNVPQIVGVPAQCQIGGSHLQVEVSTAHMVGSVTGGLVGFDRSQAISGVSSQVLGTAEGDPTVVVTAATGPGVAKVSMSFAGGATDVMAPAAGWVALAAQVRGALAYGSSAGTLTEHDSAGKVLGTQRLQLGVESSAASGSSCAVMCPGIQPDTSARGTSSAASSGSAAIGTACPPLPCTTVPRLTVPPNQPTSGTTTIKPGGVTSSAAHGAAAYACLQPAGPPGGGSGSTGSGSTGSGSTGSGATGSGASGAASSGAAP
jgi:hypothetical protein